MQKILKTSDDALAWLGHRIGVILSRGWPALAAISVLAFGTAGISLLMAGIQVTSDGGPKLSDLRGVVSGNLLGQQNSGLEGAERQIAELTDDLRASMRAASWSGRLAASASWMPVLSIEGASLHSQIGRIKSGLDNADGLLGWATGFLEAYDEAQTALLSSLDQSSVKQFRSRLTDMQSGLVDSDGQLLAVRRPYRFTLAERIEPVSGYIDDLEKAEAVMADAAEAGQKSLQLMEALLDLAEASGPLLALFDGSAPSDSTSDIDSVFAALSGFNDQAASVKAVASEAVASLSRLVDTGPFAQRLNSLERLMDALVDIGEAGVQGFEALRPAHDIVKDAEGGLLDSEGVLLNALAAVSKNLEGLSEVADRLSTAQASLRQLQEEGSLPTGSSGLPGMLDFVSEVELGLRMLDGIAPVAHRLLGSDEPRTFLMLGQSSDELRGTGGFVSALWTLEFQSDSLKGVSYYDAVRVDDWERLELYPKAPLGLEEHMNAWVWLLRDVSWDPDFPTTAQNAKAMFRIGQNQDVDGVLGINQWAFLALIEAIGGIVPPEGGDPITPNNLITVLEQGTDLYGRAYSDLVLQGVLDKLETQTSLTDLIRVASAMYKALDSRDMVLYFDDLDAQSAVEALGWAGEVKQTEGDYLYVVDSNVGWSKVDRNIERNVTYSVDLSREERPRARLTVEYVNHSGPGSAPCEPQWQNRGTDYNQLVNACYWNFIRVYIPNGSRMLSQTSLPLPELSVSAEIGVGTPGQETGALSSSHDKVIFSGLATVPALESREVELVYDLPADTVVSDGDDLIYTLTIQKQPGVKQRKLSLELVPPDGHSVASSSMPYAAGNDGLVTISSALPRDETIRVTFSKDS